MPHLSNWVTFDVEHEEVEEKEGKEDKEDKEDKEYIGLIAQRVQGDGTTARWGDRDGKSYLWPSRHVFLSSISRLGLE